MEREKMSQRASGDEEKKMIKNKDKIERWVPSEIHYPLALLCFRHVTEQYKIGQPASTYPQNTTNQQVATPYCTVYT